MLEARRKVDPAFELQDFKAHAIVADLESKEQSLGLNPIEAL